MKINLFLTPNEKGMKYLTRKSRTGSTGMQRGRTSVYWNCFDGKDV